MDSVEPLSASLDPQQKPTSPPARAASFRLGGGMTMILGLNLWLTTLVVPIMATRALAVVPLAFPAPLLLLLGLLRQHTAALLVGVPLATLVPFGLPELAAARAHVLPFFLIAPGLLGYMWAALHLLKHHGTQAALGQQRPLPAGLASAEELKRPSRTASLTTILSVIGFGSVAVVYPARAVAGLVPELERIRAALLGLAALMSIFIVGYLLVGISTERLDPHCSGPWLRRNWLRIVVTGVCLALLGGTGLGLVMGMQ